MEEENNIILTGWDNLTTTTGSDYITTVTNTGDYLISGDRLMYNSYTSWSAPYDMDFKLPDVFLKVIKLMIPEIKNVIVRNSSLTLNSLNQIENLTINLFIILDETSSNDKDYEEKIRDLFRMTFSDIDYVTLNVKQFDSNNKKFSEILRLFGK
jgi:hypothetical protein